jgi:hypothetical protein
MRKVSPIGKLHVTPSRTIHGGIDIPAFVANRMMEIMPTYSEPASRTVRPRKVTPGVGIVIEFQVSYGVCTLTPDTKGGEKVRVVIQRNKLRP